MLKDYDMSVLYHPGKANMVADAFSGLEMGSVAHVEENKSDFVCGVHILDRLGRWLVDFNEGVVVVHNGFELYFVSDVKARKIFYPIFVELKNAVLKKSTESFSQGVDDVLQYQGHFCVPKF